MRHLEMKKALESTEHKLPPLTGNRLGFGNCLPKVIRHLFFLRSRCLTFVPKVQCSLLWPPLSLLLLPLPKKRYLCQIWVQILIQLNCYSTLYSFWIIRLVKERSSTCTGPMCEFKVKEHQQGPYTVPDLVAPSKCQVCLLPPILGNCSCHSVLSLAFRKS